MLGLDICLPSGGDGFGNDRTHSILVSATGQVPNITAGIANNYTSRRSDYASPYGDITNIKCVDFAVKLQNASTMVGQVDAHVIKRYLEYPANVFHAVAWGGAATRAMGGGGNPSVHVSDAILSSVTGQPLIISAGAKFWWRTVNVTGATVTSFPCIARPAGCAALGLDDGNAGSTDLGNSGTINPTSTPNTFGPAAVIGTVMARNARGFLLIGDSLFDGTGDVSGVGAMASSGWIARGLNHARCKVAIGGQSAQLCASANASFASFLTALSGAYSDVISGLGINDMSLNSRSVAQVLADQQAVYAKFSPGARLWQTTLTARTNSSDGYATSVNQTPKSDGTYGQVNAMNAAIRAKPAPLYGVIDAADFDMTARDSVIHDGPFPPTLDGTHFTSNKAAAMANAFRASMGN